MEKISIKGIDFLRFSKLSACQSLSHFFTTRLLPLKLRNEEDRKQLSLLLNAPQILFPQQTHGNNHFLLTPKAPLKDCAPEADIILVQASFWGAGILVADCVPVILFDPQKRCFALAHVGWRGALLNVHKKAVRLIQEHFKTNPEQLLAGLGPSIRVCCFEVGKEVAKQFLKVDPKSVVYRNKRFFVDLVGFIWRDLCTMGVPPKNIEIAPWCTSCNQDLFFSFRREKEKADRMALIAWLNN
ncbi:MAG: polyphenol oxidase family protein [Candidatus Atribacteria bacterium]|nr:polyphenol oxidase family protein [Candidatus Atribacteria bacterium]MCD6349184.1 polyphenol oxidase family protein [Candidatus Atribacteria bacterium]